MRRVFMGIQYMSMLIAVVSLLVLLFTFGHTETFPQGFSAILFGVAILFSCITGIVHWVGLPPPEVKDDSNAKQ